MSGYKGYSMSNNAVMAYENGEKPLSRWTKKAIIEKIQSMQEDGDIPSSVDIDTLKRTPAADLKKVLRRSSWHHTSKMYNRTYFYEVDSDLVEVYFCKKEEPEGILIRSGEADCREYLGGGEFKHSVSTGNEYRLEDGQTYFLTETGKRYWNDDFKMI